MYFLKTKKTTNFKANFYLLFCLISDLLECFKKMRFLSEGLRKSTIYEKKKKNRKIENREKKSMRFSFFPHNFFIPQDSES